MGLADFHGQRITRQRLWIRVASPVSTAGRQAHRPLAKGLGQWFVLPQNRFQAGGKKLAGQRSTRNAVHIVVLAVLGNNLGHLALGDPHGDEIARLIDDLLAHKVFLEPGFFDFTAQSRGFVLAVDGKPGDGLAVIFDSHVAVNFAPQPTGIHRHDIRFRMIRLDIEADRQPGAGLVRRNDAAGTGHVVATNVRIVAPLDLGGGHGCTGLDQAHAFQNVFLPVNGHVAQFARLEAAGRAGQQERANQSHNRREDDGFQLIRHWAPFFSAAP
ncbi:hypothetical protein DESC_770090 [Desulfosarcina cetonica]|nr:hypothetical protein DESC_770090 [Desulfosarcina cetonica]